VQGVVVAGGVPTIMHSMVPRERAALKDSIARLGRDLSTTVGFHNSSHPERPLGPATPLLVTGELSSEPAAMQLVKGAVSQPLQRLALPLKLPPDLPVGRYTANAALALGERPWHGSKRAGRLC